MIRAPAGIVVGQQREAGDRALIVVVEPVGHREHAPLEVGLAAGLDFDVNVDMVFGAVAAVDLDELVGMAVGGVGLAQQAAQLGVEELEAA